ncbi:MAG: FAD:protein FMN transferase [Clostridia bacterium]|nr:FAD:protein FMN transferase [Clostridia bacterium]MBP3648298.1 FAD:protein FMN transferase [Clostridia bacterium]
MKRIICLLCCLMLLSSCAPASAERYTASFLDVFDTASQLVIYADSQQEANRLAQWIYAELLRYHKLFDQYNDWPNVAGIYEVNEKAAAKPVRVEPELFSLLTFAKEMYSLTKSKTNIAMGSVLRLWHQAREDGTVNPEAAYLPEMTALQDAALHADPQHLLLDEANQTVFFTDPAMKLDVGAIAKGYAVEQVALQLEAEGVNGVLLSIGGNVRAVGTRPDGTAFPVGVQNPDLTAEKKHIAILTLNNASLVTSGSYQRYYTVEGKQYHHIIDPVTLMPATHVWAVSVVTKDSGLADALSTALFNLPLEEGMKLIDSLPDTEALWVKLDGTIVMSDGIQTLLY